MFKRQSITDYDSIPVGYYHDAMLNGPSMQRFWHRKKFEKVASLVTSVRLRGRLVFVDSSR